MSEGDAQSTVVSTAEPTTSEPATTQLAIASPSESTAPSSKSSFSQTVESRKNSRARMRERNPGSLTSVADFFKELVDLGVSVDVVNVLKENKYDAKSIRDAGAAAIADATRCSLDEADLVVKGAIDEFFTRCVPRQLTVTYRDGNQRTKGYNPVYNTWMGASPTGLDPTRVHRWMD